jgi:hypothetical protein
MMRECAFDEVGTERGRCFRQTTKWSRQDKFKMTRLLSGMEIPTLT